MRKILLILLAMIAARMARRALKRGTGQYAEIMAALWRLTGLILAAGTAGTAKARNTEDRLNALVPRIPVPQPAPGTSASGVASGSNSSYSTSNSSYSTSNGSYSMGGGTQVTSNTQGSDNDGGANSTTSGASAGTPHTHSMTHFHTSAADLQNVFNALQGSYSNTIPAYNALQGSYSNTIPALNALQGSHSALVPVVNALVNDHAQLITDHNNLKAALVSSGLLH